jgi:hypothetical protein
VKEMITVELSNSISNDETVFPALKTEKAFNTLLSKKQQFDELQTAIRELKLERNAVKNAYNRIPSVAALRLCTSRINHYGQQNTNLKNGELPTKILHHDEDVKEALLIQYQEVNDKVVEQLKEKQAELQEIVDNDVDAQNLTFHLEMLDLAIKRNRDMRVPIRKQLAKRKNIGRTGIAVWNPAMTKFVSMRIYNETS